MGIFNIFRKRIESPHIPAGTGILSILFGETTELENQFKEDVSIYGETGITVHSYRVSSTQEISDLLSSQRPGLFHLLATFTNRGSLIDSMGKEIFLNDLMKLGESRGVRLFIIASENNFNNIKEHIYSSQIMNFLTILTRNKHFPSFLRGIISGLSKNPNFALAYVKLAPQHQSAQVGLPLPGSIAICPSKSGRSLVLWSDAQL
ncbi:MAG: hypothetical protein PHD29_01885 [bacterium]|nr:hypothetical protein [bacterium]MDD5755932.1 hypothetical protein [bacterium]